MVKLGIRPQHGVVALFARRGEARMRHGRRCVVEIRLVAGNARRHRNLIVVVDVTVRAWQRWRYVCSRERETGLRMIKRRRLPCTRVVANFAGLRETARHVVRIFRTLEIGQMAGNARRHRDVVVVVLVAVGTCPRGDGMNPVSGKPVVE